MTCCEDLLQEINKKYFKPISFLIHLGWVAGKCTTIKYQCGVINKQCHFMNIILNLPPLILELVSLTEREFEQKLRTDKVL